MSFGLLEFFYTFGMVLESTKPAIDLRFRAPVDYRMFYNMSSIDRYYPQTTDIIERRDIQSVEKVISLNKPLIQIFNIRAKVRPNDKAKSDKLLKRPFFDRVEETELPGDFRSKHHPFGYSWMLLPNTESLMTPKIKLREGQKWSVKMVGGNFEVHYNLYEIDVKNNLAYINATNGFCRHDTDGIKRWNASWIISTQTGVIKYMHFQQNHEHEPPLKTVQTTTTKILTRETDDETIFDYEIEYADEEEL